MPRRFGIYQFEGDIMKLDTRLVALVALTGLTTSAAAGSRLIVEDFDNGSGVAAFDPELTFDFGTSSDFTGNLDTNDLFLGELNLYSDLVTVTVNSLIAGESINSVSVTWTDFCGVGCTNFGILGMGSSASVGNALVGTQETFTLTAADIGASIDSFTLSSFEGRIDRVLVEVVPAPGVLALLGFGAMGAARRRR